MQRYVARSVVTRYAGAIVYVTATVGFALWQRPVVLASAGQLSRVANLITGWVCGLRPALVAWGLATLAFAYCFTSPLDSLRIELVQLPRVAIFTLLGLFMATMSATRRWAEDSLQNMHEELEARVRERTADPQRTSMTSSATCCRSCARSCAIAGSRWPWSWPRAARPFSVTGSSSSRSSCESGDERYQGHGGRPRPAAGTEDR